jgi:hypothetical protein
MREQTALRSILTDPNPSPDAFMHFLQQHARLHTAAVASSDDSPPNPEVSYADAVFDGMNEEDFRRIPPSAEHSPAWVLWHIARIEDATMNILVAGYDQVFNQHDWQKIIHSPIQESGNEIDREQVAAISAQVNIEALFAYRAAVGKSTRKIVQDLSLDSLNRKVAPGRIERMRSSGAVLEAADAIIKYWSRRTIAGLLLMPATRHNLVHLNEIARIIKKR